MSEQTTPSITELADVRFGRAAGGQIGYEPSHVDAFMKRARRADQGRGELTVSDVRQARFATVAGGYDTEQVDDTLDDIEDLLAAREREQVTGERGDDEWEAMLAESIEQLRGRLERAPGERFRRPSREGAESYDVEQVDELCEQITRTLGAEPGAEGTVSADDVRRAAFASAQGDEGYEEAQVDAFLDATVDVLVRRA